MMSDLEKDPAEVIGTGDCEGPALEMLEAREVVLGRTTKVRRLLPNKNRRMVGAWCFVDHYGPDDLTQRVDSYDVPGERGMLFRRIRTPACRPSVGCSKARSSTATAWGRMPSCGRVSSTS